MCSWLPTGRTRSIASSSRVLLSVVGMTMKWMGGLLALLAGIGLMASSESLSCPEVKYRGGTLVDCETMSIFQPRDYEDDADSDAGVLTSIPLPASVMGFFGAMGHGNCKTTELPEGQWTVCNDGFSMLERDGAGVARALGLRPGEEPSKNARSAARSEEYSPKRQEIERELEQARAENTVLQERLKEMEAYEAEFEKAESLARVEPGSDLRLSRAGSRLLKESK